MESGWRWTRLEQRWRDDASAGECTSRPTTWVWHMAESGGNSHGLQLFLHKELPLRAAAVETKVYGKRMSGGKKKTTLHDARSPQGNEAADWSLSLLLVALRIFWQTRMLNVTALRNFRNFFFAGVNCTFWEILTTVACCVTLKLHDPFYNTGSPLCALYHLSYLFHLIYFNSFSIINYCLSSSRCRFRAVTPDIVV